MIFGSWLEMETYHIHPSILETYSNLGYDSGQQKPSQHPRFQQQIQINHFQNQQVKNSLLPLTVKKTSPPPLPKAAYRLKVIHMPKKLYDMWWLQLNTFKITSGDVQQVINLQVSVIVLGHFDPVFLFFSCFSILLFIHSMLPMLFTLV